MYRTYTLVKRGKYEETIGKTEVEVGREREKRTVSRLHLLKPTLTPIPSTREQEPEPVGVSGRDERVDNLVRCNHCNRVFSQPLRMLDFHGELPRMIDVCPFCSEVIKSAVSEKENEKKKKLIFSNGGMNSK